ncbi:MAG: FKBP-type peptidyl-prolyl cis-trans isomerase [Coprobacter sp.]|nr:FKBP-type peptidyl-prolyl cis-trans isomerase [Coprobacter sp.]
MKKVVLFSVLLAGSTLFGMTSCDSKKNPVLKTDTDSLSYAYGILRGANMAENIKYSNMNIDPEQFLKGFAQGLNSDTARLSYELGASIGSQLKMEFAQAAKQDGPEFNKAEFLAAFKKALKNDSTALFTANQAEEIFRAQMTAFQEKKMREEEARIAESPEAKQNAAEGQKFLEAKAQEEGVVVTESGLLYKVIAEGNGEKPAADSNVKVSYKGTLIDGTQFDANPNATMFVGGVVPGFQEALMLMSPGAKYEVYIPAELGYGLQQRGPIPVNSTLIFEIELLEIIQK